MKRGFVYTVVPALFMIISSCNKELISEEATELPVSVQIIQQSGSKILIDASKDGGGWWFPQGPLTGFSSSAPHQGKLLADYLRRLGYVVDELPRGAVITTELLTPYTKVIRVDAFDDYTDAEVAAYADFLKQSSSLLLIRDHMLYTSNDKLSALLGIKFAGIAYGTISNLSAHPITNGVTSIYYNAGCAIVNENNSNMTILGRLGNREYADLNKNHIYDAGDILAPPVMGILNHPTCKVFFLAELNGIEQVPQPFTGNLVRWLFP